MKIVFLGINPAKNGDPKNPFKGTKSGKTLQAWIDYLGILEHEIEFKNVYNEKTENNKAPAWSVVKTGLEALKPILKAKLIITLGLIPKNACREMGVAHLELPHPSGLNRKLNDQREVKRMLDKVKSAIKIRRNIEMFPYVYDFYMMLAERFDELDAHLKTELKTFIKNKDLFKSPFNIKYEEKFKALVVSNSLEWAIETFRLPYDQVAAIVDADVLDYISKGRLFDMEHYK